MLTLICGIPNSGKTTYSARFGDVIHLDEVQDYSAICEMASGMENPIIEGLYLLAENRTQLLDACADHSPKRCIWLDTTLEECIRREDRNRPAFVITQCANTFEPPTYDEGWDEIVRYSSSTIIDLRPGL